MSEEKVRKLARLREIIARRVEELEEELSGLKELLSFVEDLLKELSFRRLSLPGEGEEAGGVGGPELGAPGPSPAPSEASIPLTTFEGELLATMYVGPNYVRIVPAEGKSFQASSRPFRYFVRQLKGMQDRDASLVAEGKLSPDEVLSFNIVKEDDEIREIVIKNVRSEDIRGLRSLARWAFRTMWEQSSPS